MAHILLAVLLSAQTLSPEGADLLESSSLAGWAAVPLGAGSRALIGGLPTGPVGLDRLPPWGTVDSLSVVPPLEGGLWSGGRWSLAFSDFSIPDSSYQTRVGLFQNTFDRHRYTGSLRRPLPWGLGIGVTAGREDSLRTERIRMRWRGLEFDGMAWRERQDVYSAWVGGRPLDGTFCRLELSSPRQGSRWLGGLAQWGGELGGARLMAGAALHAADDSSRLEGHGLLRLPAADALSLTARVDVEGSADSLEYGWGGGVGASLGPIRATFGGLARPGEDPEATASAEAGPAILGLRTDGNAVSAALGAGGSWGLSRLDLVASADTDDSVRVVARALPGVRIVNARFRAGGRFRALHSREGEWELGGDAMAEYRLSTFRIVVGLEDLQDATAGGTSFTYGVLWSFSDEAARPRDPDEGGEGR